MIFIAKNEDGVPSWKLAKDGKKIVTRRMKPMSIDKDFAIQPGRGKFAVCRARVIDCMPSKKHYDLYASNKELYKTIEEYKQDEAKYEGFKSWSGLMNFFQKKKIDFDDTYRIEFKVIASTTHH